MYLKNSPMNLRIALLIIASIFIFFPTEGAIHAVNATNNLFLPLVTYRKSDTTPLELCGDLVTDTTLSIEIADNYLITCPVIVLENVSLTINEGVSLFFDTDSSLQVNGTLSVNGTPSERVKFTGNNSTLFPGYWESIIFNPGSSGHIQYATVEFGGKYGRGNIQINGGFVSIFYSLVQNSAAQGVRSDTWMTLKNNQIQNNNNEAVYISDHQDRFGTYTIEGNFGIGNGRDAIIVDGVFPSNISLGENPDLPYIIEYTNTIPNGSVVTLGEGAQFRMGITGQLSGALEVSGTLITNGAADNPVVITSSADSVEAGKPGDWWRLYIKPGGTANLEYTDIKHAGAATANVYVENGTLKINNCIIAFSAGHGVYAIDSDVSITKSTINNNSLDGGRIIAQSKHISPTITENLFNNNADAALELRLLTTLHSSFTINDNTGLNNGINGIILEGTVGSTTIGNNPNFPYVIQSITIPANTSVTTAPGVVFKLDHEHSAGGSLLGIYGDFTGSENKGKPIIFTSLQDDTFGGDTNNDGSNSFPSPGDWRSVVVYSSGTIKLNYTFIQYGGYPQDSQLQILSGDAQLDNITIQYSMKNGFYAEDTSLTLQNSTISNNSGFGFRLYGTTKYIEPIIINNVFNNNNTYGMNMILNAGGTGNGVISGNTGSGNGMVNGIYIEGKITDKISYWDMNPEFPYVIWTLTIEPEAKLSIAPGIVFKFVSPPDSPDFARGTGTFLIDGYFEAVGTESAPIIFTSYWDDTDGGDTNGGYGGTVPQPGDWWSFIVHPMGSSLLEYCEFKYGGADGMAIRADGGEVNLNHGKVSQSYRNGIGGTGKISVMYSDISDNQENGFKLNGPGYLQWNTISDNGEYGLENTYAPYQGYRTPAENNYWGDISGPSYDSLPCPYETPLGYGSMVNCSVDWYPFLKTPPIAAK